MIYKLVNTADSMIGYRNARWRSDAPPRGDDLLNLVPARVHPADLPCRDDRDAVCRRFAA